MTRRENNRQARERERGIVRPRRGEDNKSERDGDARRRKTEEEKEGTVAAGGGEGRERERGRERETTAGSLSRARGALMVTDCSCGELSCGAITA